MKISVENLGKRFNREWIFKKLTYDFVPGVYAVTGPNGSGKSSFLRIFSGELPATEGNVYYAGKKIKDIKKEELAKQRAVMSQQPELSFPLTVEEVVMMGRYPHFDFNPNKKDEAICEEVMNRMELQPFRERNYLTLSGGEKQRVQYARVLAQIWEKPTNGCRYLFLDEPLNNLDINYQQQFLKIAKEFIGKETVIIAVMHDLNLAIQFADKLFFFKEGSLAAQGAPEIVLTEELIKNIFNVEARIIQNQVSNTPLLLFQ